MLSAEKWSWFETLFRIYNKNLLRRRFNSLLVEKSQNFNFQDKTIPTIVFMNHSSWWDGLVISELSSYFNLDSFVMMEEVNLRRYYLFRRLGAFSIDKNNRRGALESLNYAVDLLKNKKRTLWIFPQGEILPNDLRPFRFYNGLTWIIEKLKKVRILPAAIRYEFRNEFKPEILFKIGKPEIASGFLKNNRKSKTSDLEQNLTNVLDSLKSDLINDSLKKYLNIL